MNKFKVGDKVTPVDVSCRLYSEEMKQLVFTPLTVVDPTPGRDDTPFVLTKDSKGVDRFWFASDLRLVVDDSEPTDPLPEEEKPLERGDLVEFCGAIWVVFSKDADGEYRIAPLTGGSNCCYSVINKLPRVGSISKKVNRLQAQMEDEE